MATRTMTITIPTEMEIEFLRLIPEGRRSEFVAEAIRAKLNSERTKEEREATISAACNAVNPDPNADELEWEFDELIGMGSIDKREGL